MKKIFYLILACLIVTTLFACEKNTYNASEKQENDEFKFSFGDYIKVLKVIDFGEKKVSSIRHGNGLYCVVSAKSYYFIDTKGEITTNNAWNGSDKNIFIEINKDFAIKYDFVDGIQKFGIVDKNGKWVLKPEYTEIYGQYAGKNYYVVKDNKLKMLDEKFNILYIFDYHKPNSIKVGNTSWGARTYFANNTLNMYNVNKWGFIDVKGNIVIDCQYDKSLNFNSIGISSANKDGKGYYINMNNERVLQNLLYDETKFFSNDGLAFVKKNDKWGIIDTSGREIFPCIFDDMRSNNYYFSNGTALVKYKGKLLLLTYLDPSRYGYSYEDVNNAYKELAELSGDSGFWNSLSSKLIDKIEKKNWTENDYQDDFNYTLTYKSIEPNAWYVTGAGVWYYFENDRATSKKGWFVDNRDGQTYYLDPTTGRMAVGWTEIDGNMYYFNESHDNEPNWYEIGGGFYESYGKKVKAYGSMFRDEKTPDGKVVDKDGKLN